MLWQRVMIGSQLGVIGVEVPRSGETETSWTSSSSKVVSKKVARMEGSGRDNDVALLDWDDATSLVCMVMTWVEWKKMDQSLVSQSGGSWRYSMVCSIFCSKLSVGAL